MDLEIVGRHALLFDDDATAEIVNSGGSLVPWAAAGAVDLLLDRHDVRHLLDRVPPRPRRAYPAALLSAPSPDGVPEAELDRERFLDLPDDDGGGEGTRDASSSGNKTDTGQADYNAVPFSYGSSAGSDVSNNPSSYYCPSFPVPESLLNKLPPSEKVHQIIARTALFVSEHGGQTEIVLRVKQGSNPTFGFLMPHHHLHSYFRYLVDHPHLLKDSTDAGDTKSYKTVNSESEHATSSGGALSLLGAIYESGDEEEGMLPTSSSIDPGNDVAVHKQGHEGPVFAIHDNKELKKGQTVAAAAATADKDKTLFTKKNPMFTANSRAAAYQEKRKDSMTLSTTSRPQHSKLAVTDTKEVILEPPSFLKRIMEKIVEFIIRNGKEFEEKLIEQDRATGKFPFLLPSNPYHSYYLKILQEYHESKSRGGSSEHKDRSSSGRKDRSSTERKDRNSSRRKGSSYSKEGTKTKVRKSTNKDSSASDSSSEESSEKQLCDKQPKRKFQMVIGGVKKEPPRKVTADEAAAIVMAATRGLGPTSAPPNTLKDTRDFGHTRGNSGHSSSFGSFSSLQDPDAASKHASNSETGTSLTSSGQLKRDGIGIIDDDWIANTIAKAAAVAASKEADSSEASMTKEQKLKAERLRRAKMFAAIIKSEGNKVTGDPTKEPANATPADLNFSGPDSHPLAKEREGSSIPFEREGSNLIKQEKDSDDEQNRVHKYRKKRHSESDEGKEDVKERYKHSRKKHRSEHSRSHSEDVHKHKYSRHSKDQESRHHRHHHSSSEDEREHKSSKSRHHRMNDDEYTDDDEHRRSHRHRRDHCSSSKRKHEDGRDHTEQKLGLPEASQSTSGHKLQAEKPLSDTAQSSQATTEVPNELRAKIRAMLLETL